MKPHSHQLTRLLSRPLLALVCLWLLSPPPSHAAGAVYRQKVTPNWFENNARFWYRNDLRGGTREFILVDAVKGTRQPAFDHAKLAAALAKAAGAEFQADKLPFETIEFVAGGKAVRFEAAKQAWELNLNSYECSKATPRQAALATDLRVAFSPAIEVPAATAADESSSSPQERPEGSAPARKPAPPAGEMNNPARSPDGKWTAFLRNHNVFVRAEADGKETALSTDGQPGHDYGRLAWAPDSKALVGWRIEPGETKEVYMIQSSPPGGGRAVLKKQGYPLPGDKFATHELSVFDVAQGRQIKPPVGLVDFGSPGLRWLRDGFRFTYEKMDRGHQRFRIIEVDTHTGTHRNLIDEQTKTFIWTVHTEGLKMKLVTYLDQTEEILHVNETSGWRHLYLIDAKAGALKNAVTKGEWVLRGIDRIDEAARQIWFTASGVYPGQDPYLLHFGRVNFDGSGLVFLTEGHGQHAITYSPDNRFIIDSYNRADLPPVTELRRVADGQFVCALEKADVTDAEWKPSEVFVAKGRDGKTDIWGIIERPLNFDPTKKYPIIEDIYAGPQDSYVPKTFSTGRRFASLTDLGFVVVKIDGMGTANRSKAFHDVCWKNLKDGGFPDRIAWIKAAAAKYPYMDATRVGLYGGSAGGQNAAGAVLFHPDFYSAAVANCGCHDNRMDKASWNEQWMGYPVGPHYAENSNIENAHRLRGHLFLIVGELDNNVPPESTYRLLDALIKAGKDVEFLVVTGGGHGSGGGYGNRRRNDFFLRHLQKVEPPNRNAETRQAAN
ncbi:MAG: prolyl oligopeptidase family serine peptidase [Verrucomicrobia bacterium]|nr:MAG: prolyl oligopeptidase family serine peptidase [Verrucomicrobiota bacterium]